MSAAVLAGALGLAAVLYARGVHRAGRWPRRRSAAWAAGIVVVAAALLGGPAAAADADMRAHMAQHLGLVVLAAPLLLAGAPLLLALRTEPALRPGLRALLASRAVRAALHPALAVSLFAVVLAGSHVPAVYDAAVDHPAVHVAEHAAYLGSAGLFWAVVLGVRPLPGRRSPLVRVLCLLLAMPPMALVGVAILSSARPLYDHYALADQHAAGQLMWIGGTLPMAALVLVLAVAGVLEEERRQVRREAYGAGEGAR